MNRIALVLFVFSSCQTTKKFTALDLPSGTISSIDSLCLLNLDRGHFPGLAIAVVEKGNKVWSKGYGYAEIESKRPIDADDDLFRIGSISKTITASALARMTERGIVNLDEPISNYYHACPEDKSLLTLRQVGGHTAGFRHYRGAEFLSNIHYQNIQDALEVFIHDTLLFAPGTDYNYSTYGFTVVSKVMEEAAAKPFLSILQDEVRAPLNLTDMRADMKDSTQFHRVQFYDFQSDHLIISPQVDLSNKWAGGGLLCSAEDLARFGFALTGPGYLKESTLTEFTTSQELPNGKKTNYGIGLRIGKDAAGRVWYGHSGGSVGGTSMLMIFPEEDLSIVTLVNLTSAEMDDLAMKIAVILRKAPLQNKN